MWEVINEVRGKKKKTIKPQFVVDGVRVVERRVIANKFNEYFASIASKMNDNITDNGLHVEPLPSFLEYMPSRTTQSIYFYECDSDEISEIIADLKNGKASDFPIRVIKNCLISLAQHWPYNTISLSLKENSHQYLNLEKSPQSSKKKTKSCSKIIGLFQPSHSLVKYLKRLYINDYIAFWLAKEFFMIANSASEKAIQHPMP